MGEPESLTPAAPLVDAHGRVTADIECLSCGYNLRGLMSKGQCPECGSGNIESVTCIWRDREWVAAIRSGLSDLELAAWLTRLCFPVWMIPAVRGTLRVTHPHPPLSTRVIQPWRDAARISLFVWFGSSALLGGVASFVLIVRFAVVIHRLEAHCTNLTRRDAETNLPNHESLPSV